MLGLRSGRLARPRGFTYIPRHYDADAEERRKRRLRFSRPSDKRQRKTRQPAFIAVGLGLVLALYVYSNLEVFIERMAAFGTFFFGG